ncbi:MAG: DUF5362 family protein [Gammaproteobacteria bacterium]
MNTETDQTIAQIALPLFNAKGWMKFLAVLMIIYGVMMVFTIWGILLCWLPIWIGVSLYQAATAVERAYISQQTDELVRAMMRLKTFFTVQGVLMLITLVLSAAGFLMMGFGMFAMMAGQQSGQF